MSLLTSGDQRGTPEEKGLGAARRRECYRARQVQGRALRAELACRSASQILWGVGKHGKIGGAHVSILQKAPGSRRREACWCTPFQRCWRSYRGHRRQWGGTSLCPSAFTPEAAIWELIDVKQCWKCFIHMPRKIVMSAITRTMTTTLTTTTKQHWQHQQQHTYLFTFQGRWVWGP